MKKQLVILAALLVAPFVTLNSELTPAYAQPRGSLVIAGQSIGKIRLGMSSAQVRKLLGKPDKTLATAKMG